MGYYDIFPDAGIADIGGVHEARPRAAGPGGGALCAHLSKRAGAAATLEPLMRFLQRTQLFRLLIHSVQPVQVVQAPSLILPTSRGRKQVGTIGTVGTAGTNKVRRIG